MSCQHRISYSLLLCAINQMNCIPLISSFSQKRRLPAPIFNEKEKASWALNCTENVGRECLSTPSPTLLYAVCLRQWGWKTGASQMHLTPPCCPGRPVSSLLHLAETRTMLDSWVCIRLQGNKVSTRLTEWDRSVNLKHASYWCSKIQYFLHFKSAITYISTNMEITWHSLHWDCRLNK